MRLFSFDEISSGKVIRHKNLTGEMLKIHFSQNKYYYLSIAYKFFEKQAFSFHFFSNTLS